MTNLNDDQVRNEMSVYVDIAMIVYTMILQKLDTYSEISIKEKHLIAGQLTHGITLKACVNENSGDIIYQIERIADNLEIQSSTRNS